MNNRIKRLFLFWVYALLLCGCSSVRLEESGLPEVDPNVGREVLYSAKLYYQYLDEPLLVPIEQEVPAQPNERIEAAKIRRLTASPPDYPELSSALPPGTRAVSIAEENDILFVTLNRETFAGQTQQNYLRTLAIVNSLLQPGGQKRVQPLVDPDGSGVGIRPTRAELGFIGGKEDALFEPMGYSEESLMTARNVAELLFTHLMNGDLSRAYTLMADSEEGRQRPGFDAFEEAVVNAGTITGYAIQDERSNGANVQIEVQIERMQSGISESHAASLRFFQEGVLLRPGCYSLIALLMGGGD